jgi:hypothetical protein
MAWIRTVSEAAANDIADGLGVELEPDSSEENPVGR